MENMTTDTFIKFASMGFCSGFSIGMLTLFAHLLRRGMQSIFRLPSGGL